MTCEFCAVVAGAVESDEIYQDEYVKAVLHLKPASPGQVLVFPKQHHAILEQVPDNVVEHLFQIVNKVSVAVFEAFDVQGTNVIIENGVAAGQSIPHVSVHIIPRNENDGLNFQWDTLQLSDDELTSIQETLKKALEKKTEEKKEEKKLSDEENYLIKQLRRIA